MEEEKKKKKKKYAGGQVKQQQRTTSGSGDGGLLWLGTVIKYHHHQAKALLYAEVTNECRPLSSVHSSVQLHSTPPEEERGKKHAGKLWANLHRRAGGGEIGITAVVIGGPSATAEATRERMDTRSRPGLSDVRTFCMWSVLFRLTW